MYYGRLKMIATYFRSRFVKFIFINFIFCCICSCGFTPSLKVQIDKEQKRSLRNLTLELKTTENVNSLGGKIAKGRPLKMCIYQIKRPGWFPPLLLIGQGCTEKINNDSDAIQVINKIIKPNSKDSFELQIPTEEPITYMVAAEFSNISIANRTLQVTIEPGQEDQSLSFHFDSVIYSVKQGKVLDEK